jgi:hypothetical protein
MIRNTRVANSFGFLSLVLSVIPVAYIFHAEIFPDAALTEAAVLIGGVGGSLLAAVGAGLIGSRWWFIAVLAAGVDVIFLWGFSP